MRKQALGKGLDAILGRAETAASGQGPEPVAAAALSGGAGLGEPLLVAIEKVAAGRGQPRRRFDDDALDELASSIREKGVLQPLVVVRAAGGYELIAGERRLRAAARAGLDVVPVIVKADVDAGELLELALIENIQREDLTPLEQARAYQRLVEEYSYTQEQVAKRLGKSRVAVTNTMRLLALPDPVREVLEQGLLSEGHARTLLSLATAAQQITAARTVVRKGLSVRATEDLVRAMGRSNGGGSSQRKAGRSADPAIEAVEQTLSRALSTKVRIRVLAAKGKAGRRGRIEIDYYSDGELDRLLELFGP